MSLSQRVARRVEGVAAVHQDDAAGRETGVFAGYPEGGQDRAGVGTKCQRGANGCPEGKGVLFFRGLSPVHR